MFPRIPRGYARSLLLSLLLLGLAAGAVLAQKSREQARTSLQRVEVPVDQVRVSDGDTVVISWSEEDRERVRVLGIDTPEVGHENHFIDEDQPYGPAAREFAEEVFENAERVEILRAAEMDPYGRTLAYLFVDGVNYSVMVVEKRLAYETVRHYGDNGLPEEAAAVLAAWEIATQEGELPFEPPYKFRQKMREKQNAEEEAPAEQEPKNTDSSGSGD